MKNNGLEEVKLNMFQKINKWNILRRIVHEKDIFIWQNIKDPKLKLDRDILQCTWTMLLEKRDFGYLNLFPQGFKIERALEDQRLLPYLDEQTQTSIVVENPQSIGKCSPSVQKKLALENPIQYIRFVQSNVQSIVMPQLDENIQQNLCNNNPNLILYMKEEERENYLRKLPLSCEPWQVVIGDTTSLDLDKILKYHDKGLLRHGSFSRFNFFIF